jgi:LAS superfamily LD-carboxypeptidase LdcB
MKTSDSIDIAQGLGQTESHLHYLSERIAIHKGMQVAWDALVMSAKSDAIDIKIASGFRSFERQILLWNNKFSGKTLIKNMAGNNVPTEGISPEALMHSILLYSALPGASRHHWGCDIDIYASNLLEADYQLKLEPWEYSKQGPLAKLSAWLTEHAHQFGFYFPYAHYQGGIAAEPWHLSYLPLANKFQQAFNIDLLAEALTKSQILGKDVILENLDEITVRYINNLCPAPTNIMVELQ